MFKKIYNLVGYFFFYMYIKAKQWRISGQLCIKRHKSQRVFSTTTQSATHSQTSCVDTQTSCSCWASYCYLLTNINPHPCPKTCNVCTAQPTTTTTTTTTKANCVDIATVCSAWVNYCYLLVSQNPHPCAKTCKIC